MDENTLKLKNYIQQQYQLGQAPDAISNQLVAAGWPAEQVHQAFLAIQAEMMPQNVSAGPAVNQQRPGMIGRIKIGWVLFKQSMVILRNNPYLLRYLAMTLGLIIAFNVVLVAVIYFGQDQLFTNDSGISWLMYVLIFISYVVSYFIINFYAAALTSNILDTFKGNQRPYVAYLEEAQRRIGPIFIFSLLTSIVGMFLQYVVERIRFVGWLLSYLLGTAWSLGTLFVIPLIMAEDASATTAIKRSFQAFRQTWGETITAKVSVNFPLGCIQIIWAFLGIAIIMPAIYLQSIPLLILLISIYIIVMIALSILGSFINNLLNVALYFFASNRQVPPGFTADMLNQVFVPRKKRWYHKSKS